MIERDDYWASDVPISEPSPLEDEFPNQVHIGGFLFTETGLRFDITTEERDALFTPFFLPGAGL